MARARKPQGDTLSTTHFPSVSVMVAAMSDRNTFRKAANADIAHKAMTREGSEKWLGVSGTAGVLDALRNGYPEGERLLNNTLAKISGKLPRALGHNRTIVRGDSGDSLDIHAVNRGSLDKAWSSAQRRVKTGSGIIRIVVDICGNGATSPHTLAWRGVTAVALCNIMQKAGYSVELVAAMATRGSDVNQTIGTLTTVVVKPRNTKPDFGFLSAVLTLTGFFRTVGFAAIVHCVDKAGKTASTGLGKYQAAVNLLPVQSKVTQLTVDGSVNSKHEAVEFINNAVALLQHSTMRKER